MCKEGRNDHGRSGGIPEHLTDCGLVGNIVLKRNMRTALHNRVLTLNIGSRQDVGGIIS